MFFAQSCFRKKNLPSVFCGKQDSQASASPTAASITSPSPRKSDKTKMHHLPESQEHKKVKQIFNMFNMARILYKFSPISEVDVNSVFVNGYTLSHCITMSINFL